MFEASNQAALREVRKLTGWIDLRRLLFLTADLVPHQLQNIGVI